LNDEDTFVAALSKQESNDNIHAWGDSGRACGRFQQHPSFYASWGPRAVDFGGVERDWDWAFVFAVRKFFRAARATQPTISFLKIAMAFHLHGQIRWDGWDEAYATRWTQLSLPS
jgi:hypothetical protein